MREFHFLTSASKQPMTISADLAAESRSPLTLPALTGPIKVLFCGDEFPSAYNLSAELLHKEPDITAEWCPREEVPKRIKNCNVVVPRMTRLTRDIISGADSLRLIVQFGVGLEGVDIAAATEKGVHVARIPSASTGNAASCAEHCVYLLLGLLRFQKGMAKAVEERRLGQPMGLTLQGRTVLITGYGAIGRELALRLQPFGVRIIGLTRSWNDKGAGSGVPSPLHMGGGMDQLHEFLPLADAVVTCNQLSDDTRGFVDYEFIASCKEGVNIVNIARGGLLDYGAVKQGLETGRIGGLGLDVTWHEPFDPEDPIYSHPNVIVTPHVGGVTDKSYKTMAKIIRDTIVQLRCGLPLSNVEVVTAT